MRKFLTAIGIFVVGTSFGQTTDAELWVGAGLSADINKKFNLSYETQGRFYKNASTLKTYYNELSGSYKLSKSFDVGLAYRFSRRNQETYFSSNNRLCLNVGFAKKLGDSGLKLKLRGRYQFGFDRISTETYSEDYRNLLRLKLDLKYELKDFKRVIPVVGAEIFRQLSAPVSYAPFNAYRLYVGFNFDLPARHSVSVRYLFERENNAIQNNTHNYVIMYNYELPAFKKKK
ncbi:MAG: DUF2490 domain-containing protein [Crocinitomix sp.]|nr:DUF2490 domain-containing protein [Crocinitomix sp.]